jgi:hypothetical protein
MRVKSVGRNISLRALCEAVKAARLADLPVAKALEALADMPEARAFQLKPDVLRRMLIESLPEQYASVLFERAGYRVKVPLADLAYLARHDQTLAELVISVILYLDK